MIVDFSQRHCSHHFSFATSLCSELQSSPVLFDAIRPDVVRFRSIEAYQCNNGFGTGKNSSSPLLKYFSPFPLPPFSLEWVEPGHHLRSTEKAFIDNTSRSTERSDHRLVELRGSSVNAAFPLLPNANPLSSQGDLHLF